MLGSGLVKVKEGLSFGGCHSLVGFINYQFTSNSIFPQGELRRDDTCLEFSGKGVRLTNMRCSTAGTNQNQVVTCSKC